MSSDITHFLKTFVIFGVGSVAQSAAGFLLIPLFTKFFSASEYGAYTIIWLIGSIFSSFLYLGITSALPRFFYSRNNAAQKVVFSTGFYLVVAAAVVQISIGILSAKFLSQFFLDDEKYQFSILFSIVGGALTFVSYYLISFLRLIDKPWTFVSVNFLAMIANIAATFLMIEKYGLLSPFLAISITQLVLLLVLIYYFLSGSWLKGAVNKGDVTLLICFGFPIAISSLSSLVIDWSDRFILELFHGMEDVGVYSLAYKLAGLVNIFLVVPFVQIFGPMMMKKMGGADTPGFFEKIFLLYYIASWLILIAVVLFFKDAYPYLVRSPSYGDISVMVYMITAGLLAYGATNIFNAGLLFEKKTHTLMYINYAIAIFNVALNFILVPKYGAMGCAVATFLAYTISPFLVGYFAKGYFQFHPFSKNWRFYSISFIWLLCIFGMLSAVSLFDYFIARFFLFIGAVAAIFFIHKILFQAPPAEEAGINFGLR